MKNSNNSSSNGGHPSAAGTGTTTTAASGVSSLSDQSQPHLEAAHHSNQRRHAEVVKVMIEVAGSDNEFMWWEEDIDRLGVEELRRYLVALEELRRKAVLMFDEVRMMEANSPMQPPINPNHHFTDRL